ncbi:FAD-binding oxidoreductase, partial [bacterium]|nr:FAD-binding oxidoreductase [bacterium]
KDFLAGIPLHPGTCLRIGTLPHETEELNRACELNLGLEKSNFSRHIFTDTCDSLVHVAPNKSQSITLNKKYFSSVQAKVVSVAESQEGCTAILDSGEKISSEMVILANSFRISELEPWLKEMLVPMSDIETFWHSNIRCSTTDKPITLRASSGHVAAALIPEEIRGGTCTWTIKLSGPRFMLPRAGVGIDLCGKPVDESFALKIKDWLKTQLLPSLSNVLPHLPTQLLELELAHARFGVDCLPCDELPILGDLGQSGRILASTGWLGCGWSASFQSASILCEIIETGRSARLAPLLRPRRWRSGMNEDGVTGMT